VLFAAGEGRSEIKKRVRAWEKTYLNGARAKDFVLASPAPLVADEELWNEFIAGAKRKRPGGYRLVVLDTVGRTMQGLNENAQQDASRYTKLADRISRDLAMGDVRCTVLGLHHVGLDEKNADRPRGSNVFTADADTIAVVIRDGKDFNCALRVTRQKDGTEWEKSRIAKLHKVSLSLTEDSLVIAAAKGGDTVSRDTSEAAGGRTRSRRGANGHTGPDVTFMDLLDKAVSEVLESNKTRPWSTVDLAEKLAMREDMGDVSSASLKRRDLKTLREQKSRRANKLYDPDTKRWRWSGK
jgi:hypothetical protein